ncbi:MAG: VWA domain-containing protein [Acidobacteriota bacterium]|nr:VWA domain-containing protein [Blastocatellia bacterium]MDW8413678.1 VWA domain-containing protein [Acidobacteriota bacterium]
MTARLAMILLLLLLVQAAAQSGRIRRNPPSPPTQIKQTQELQKVVYAEEDAEASDLAMLKIDATLVTVPAIVIDYAGRYVPFLKPSDFVLKEDGVQQDITFFAAERVPFDVIIVMDTSRSISASLSAIQDSACRFVHQLDEGDRVSVIEFNSKVRVLTELTSDKTEVEQSIRQTKAGGGTRLYDGLYEAAKRLKAIDRRKAIILLTDGEDTISKTKVQVAANAVAESGALVYVIQFPGLPNQSCRSIILPPTFPTPGSGDYPDATFLKTLVELSGGDLYRASSRDSLLNIWHKIASELRHVYVLGYYPSNPIESGGTRKIQLSLKAVEGKLRYRKSYQAKVARP